MNVHVSFNMELEHIIGFNGEFSNTSIVHPTDPSIFFYAAGSLIIMESRIDAHEQQTLKFHDGTVNSLAISSDGLFLLSSQCGSRLRKDRPSSVAVWNLQKMSLQGVFEGLSGDVLACDISPDGRFISAAAQDNILRIWDLHTGDVILTRKINSECSLLKWGPISRAVGPNGGLSKYPAYILASALGKDLFIMQVEYDVGQVGYTVTATDPVALPTVASVQRRYLCAEWAYPLLLLGNSVGEMAVVNSQQKVFRAAISVCTNGLHAIKSCVDVNDPNSPLELYIGGGDGSLSQVRLVGGVHSWQHVRASSDGSNQAASATLESGWELTGYTTRVLGGVKSISCCGSPYTVLIGTSACRVYQVLFDSPSGTFNSRLVASKAAINSLSASKQASAFFATASDSGEALVWSLEDYSVRCHTEFQSAATSVYLDSYTLIVGYADGTVRGFILDGDGNSAPQAGIEYNPHGPLLRNAHTQGVATYHGLKVGEKIGNTAVNVAVSPGAKHTSPSMPVSANASWVIPNAHHGKISSITVVAGVYLVTGGGAGTGTGAADGTVRVWNLNTRSMLQELSGTFRKPITAMCPDVAVPNAVHITSGERIVSRFDVRTGRKLSQHTAPVHIGALLGVSQRKDRENEAVTCTADGQIVFWDRDYADNVGTMTDSQADPKGVISKFLCCSVSPSGKFVAVGTEDFEVKVWDLESETVIFTSDVHSGPVTCLDWTADGKQFISGALDGTLAVWDVFA